YRLHKWCQVEKQKKRWNRCALQGAVGGWRRKVNSSVGIRERGRSPSGFPRPAPHWQFPPQPTFRPRQTRQADHPRYDTAPVTTRITPSSCRSICAVPVLTRGGIDTSSREQAADLIHRQCAEIRQYRHVYERENRPAPAVRLAADHRQRRGTLAAQGEEHHHRQSDRDREQRPGRVAVARLALQLPAQILAVSLVAGLA